MQVNSKGTKTLLQNSVEDVKINHLFENVVFIKISLVSKLKLFPYARPATLQKKFRLNHMKNRIFFSVILVSYT